MKRTLALALMAVIPLLATGCPSNSNTGGMMLEIVGGGDSTTETADGTAGDVEPDLCVPSCFGKECGDDGCGGSCGECPEAAPFCDMGVCKVDCTPDCDGKECGDDGCGGVCGLCGEGTTCEGGICKFVCQPDCDGKECGPDGCGGTCGLCPDDAPECVAGVCVGQCLPACGDKECGPDGCGSTCGVCDDGFYCNAGYCEEQCISDPGCEEPGLVVCLDDGVSYQVCEEVAEDCLKFGEAESCDEGSICMEGECIQVCVPDCQGKVCGSDGCGGECGECPENQTCTDDGQCVDVCIPSCDGKECGGDGCGGTCGECGPGLECVNFQCVCDGVVCDGFCCPAGTVCYNGDCCEPSCEGLECGSDGCGGNCGKCVPESECVNGQCSCLYESCGNVCCPAGFICDANGECVEPCVPNCDNVECGDDGCGGTCGECGPQEACTADGLCACLFEQCAGECCQEDAVCTANGCCLPDCAGQECGSDGCGGSCGTCAENELCGPAGQCLCKYQSCGNLCCEIGEVCENGVCIKQCVPDCAGLQCGDDGCGGSCGECPGLYDVCVAGQCVCVPDCTGKECGDDGCGGSCGACDDGLQCTVDSCAPDGLCEFDDSACCSADVDCDDGDECTIDTCLDNGNCQHAPDPACCTPTLIHEFFEDQVANGMTLDPAVNGVGWVLDYLDNDLHHWHLYYGNPDTGNFDNGEANSGSVTTKVFDLAAGVGYSFKFAVWMDVEETIGFDYFAVEMSLDGGEYSPVWTKDAYTTMAAWQTVLLDVSSLGGHQVQFRFFFDSIDAISNETTGVRVDNVQFKSDCLPRTCAVDEDCNDDVLSTVETCEGGQCVMMEAPACNSWWDCEDGDPCTQDQCVNQSYCVFVPIADCCASDGECDDGNPCTTDACVDQGQYPTCQSQPVEGCCLGDEDCNDYNPCTADTCPGAGESCVFVPLPGCCNSALDCLDDDPCTEEFCVDNACEFVNSCCQVHADCDDGDPCTDDHCQAGQCVFQPNFAPGCCVPPLFRDDFSTDMGWEYGETWERAPAVASQPTVGQMKGDPANDHSSSNDNMLAGVIVGGNAGGPQHPWYYLTSPVINLGNSQSPVLFIWRMLNSDYPPYMENRIQVYNGQDWVTVWQPSEGGGFFVDQTWTKQSINLAQHKSTLFRVRFGYRVGNGGVYASPSWSLDDVLIVDMADAQKGPLCCELFSDCQGPLPLAGECSEGFCQ